MENAKLKEAYEKYEKYIDEGIAMFPPFKGFGLKIMQFAIDEPEMYNLIFSSRNSGNYLEYLYEQMHAEKVMPYLMKSLELNETNARWLFESMAFYIHGMASVATISDSIMTMEEISYRLGTHCRGLLMQLNAPADERVGMMPTINPQDTGKVEEYIKGRKKIIIGYGAKREMYQIRIEAIMYFEAVGENVFAYTKENVYEIKQRLYKIEEEVSSYSFIRASKSLLVNTKKISSVSPDAGGRLSLRLINGEIVIASRGYAKQVMDVIKEAAN